MIIRIVVVDPDPPDPINDIIVYQVPEHSRAHALLLTLLKERNIECIEMGPSESSKRKKR